MLFSLVSFFLLELPSISHPKNVLDSTLLNFIQAKSASSSLNIYLFHISSLNTIIKVLGVEDFSVASIYKKL